MNFSKLVEIHHKEIEEKTIIWYPEIRDLCSRPYPNHPKGCPNIEKCKQLDIPNFGTLTTDLKYKYHYYLVYAKFEFFKYWILRLLEAIKKKKLDFWTSQRLICLKYWQNSVKSILSKFLNHITLNGAYVLGCGSGFKLTHQKQVGSMENSCINVFSTMKLNGTKLEVRPKNIIYLVCLVCSRVPIDFNEKHNEKQKKKEQKSLEVFL